MNLSQLMMSRSCCPDKPSWTAIFTKAYALVSDEFPDLRRAYIKIPHPQLYEYPASVASVAFEREYEGGKAILIGRVKNPGSLSLDELTEKLRVFANAPLEEMKDFRRALRMCRMPRMIRRLVWWFLLNSGRRRGSYFGTFGVRPASGAEALHPASPLTTLLTFGDVDDNGIVDVRLVYDQRVLDEATVANVLSRLEETLNGPMADELRQVGVVHLRLVA